MYKKIIILSIFCCFINSASYSMNIQNIARPSLKSEVKQFLKNHDKAYSKHDIDEIRTFYDNSYKSADGFDVNDLAQMLEKTYQTYDNLKYKTKINNITVSDNWAIIQMSDKTSAIINPVKNRKIKKEKLGVLKGKSSYIIYMKKDKNEWKIIKDSILAEETILKYGIAKKIDIDLITPIFIKNGEQYDLSLKIDKPNDIVALASISREEIIYPPNEAEDRFRKLPDEGELERLVKANNKNLDEYGSATIGFTKVSMNEEQTKARIEVLGMAYIIKRINMENSKNINDITKDSILVEKK